MRILFLTSAAPARAGFSTSEKRPPLGLAGLMAIMKRRGDTVFFSDEYLKKTSIANSSFVVDKKIDYVGIYANTVCYQSTCEIVAALHAKRRQGHWHGKIIVGGPHTSVGQTTIPAYVDHSVIGEGEISLPKLIDGAVSERIITGERVGDMDALPFPAWEELIFRGYDWRAPFDIPDTYPCYTMNTSRGCPFNCTFCTVKAVWGRTYRCMSAERVVSDIERMIRCYGARSIYFREDHFTLNRNRTIEFCGLLLKKNIKIKWMCETRADDLNDYEYVRLMADAGCVMLYVGVESGSPRMLEYFKKGETVEQFQAAFETIRKAGIRTYASFVLHAPTETDMDRALTEKLIETIKPDYVGRNIYVGLPGGELYNYLVQEKLYEYIDEAGIAYPTGYLANIKKYYGNKDCYRVYKKRGLFKPRPVAGP